MCNCSKIISVSECHYMIELYNDSRFFIYMVGDEGLEVALVNSGENPNAIAKQRDFYNSDGLLEWYGLEEHPCIKEYITNHNL